MDAELAKLKRGWDSGRNEQQAKERQRELARLKEGGV